MKKIVPAILLACLCFVQAHAAASDPDIDAVLTGAEGLFKAMQKKDYPGIWAHLSKKSHDTIAADTMAAMKSSAPARAAVEEDFSQGGVISRAYWEAYLKYFDPAMVLDQSRWEMGSLKASRAEIVITFRKAKHPATLYMVKEDDSWRVSLTESFWSRKQ